MNDANHGAIEQSYIKLEAGDILNLLSKLSGEKVLSICLAIIDMLRVILGPTPEFAVSFSSAHLSSVGDVDNFISANKSLLYQVEDVLHSADLTAMPGTPIPTDFCVHLSP